MRNGLRTLVKPDKSKGLRPRLPGFTMAEHDRILEIIYAGVDEFNAQQPDGFKLAKSPDAALVGSRSILDSLGLLTLLVALEGKVADSIGKQVVLLDESALGDENGPLRTLGSLAELVLSQV